VGRVDRHLLAAPVRQTAEFLDAAFVDAAEDQVTVLTQGGGTTWDLSRSPTRAPSGSTRPGRAAGGVQPGLGPVVLASDTGGVRVLDALTGSGRRAAAAAPQRSSTCGSPRTVGGS
jgi:hypothetical protein